MLSALIGQFPTYTHKNDSLRYNATFLKVLVSNARYIMVLFNCTILQRRCAPCWMTENTIHQFLRLACNSEYTRPHTCAPVRGGEPHGQQYYYFLAGQSQSQQDRVMQAKFTCDQFFSMQASPNLQNQLCEKTMLRWVCQSFFHIRRCSLSLISFIISLS